MSVSPKSERIRTLSASSRARREQRRSTRQRRRLIAGGGSLAVLIAVPLSVAAYMGVESAFPGLDAAKSLMALLEDRSPGDRTAAELTKTKKKVAAAPEQRALGKINKPEAPSEFLDAIAPPPPAVIDDVPAFPVALAGLGPLVEIPAPPRGGGGIFPTVAPPPGGGGGGGGTENPPPTNNPPGEPTEHENPPPPPVVPEPGTWATMLLGFALTGWLMRRRRRQGSAAALA